MAPNKKRAPKNPKTVQSKKTVAPPTSYLPRAKAVPRELLPIFATTSLNEIIEDEFSEFQNIQEYLPCLSLVTDSKAETNLYSRIESLTISGEPDGYFINTQMKFCDISGVQDVPLFVKRVHLVEPIPAMQGDYIFPHDGALPQADNKWQRTLAKIHNPLNEAYIDALCGATMARLVETGTSPHWIRLYGTFNARVDSYMYNITGEISNLRHDKWFQKNQKAGIFTVRVIGEEDRPKNLVEIVEDGGVIDCDQLDEEDGESEEKTAKNTVEDEADDEVTDETDTNKEEDDETTDEEEDETTDSDEDEDEDEESDSECKSDSPPSDEDESVAHLAERMVRIVKIDDDDESSASKSGSSTHSSNTSNSSSSSMHNQCEYYAEFDNFPVQVSLLERCEATMDSLLDVEELTSDATLIETRDERWSAWIYQIITALSVAQHYYGFVHNDLHTNNIMWTATEETHLYYKLNASKDDVTYYKVPTFGRLMKIIDFGRASFWLKNRDELLITDSYADGNDAAGQYNCPPYYDPTEPRVDPNPSFDLCRLAVSMFDAIYPESPPVRQPEVVLSQEVGRTMYETESELFNLLWMWLTDDKGQNILRNPDDTERFPDFDLYKYIARHANKCIPHQQAKHPYFDKMYKIQKDEIPAGTKIWEVPVQ